MTDILDMPMIQLSNVVAVTPPSSPKQ